MTAATTAAAATATVAAAAVATAAGPVGGGLGGLGWTTNWPLPMENSGLAGDRATKLRAGIALQRVLRNVICQVWPGAIEPYISLHRNDPSAR